MGAEHEQHSEPGGGESAARADLQLIDLEAAIHSGKDYFHQDEEKQELLRTCDEFKEHRVEIAAFFEAHESPKERSDFLRSFFDSTFVEQILESGQRVGHRAYANALNLWRGAYLSRESECFLRWRGVADTVHGMMLMGQWLDPDERTLPSETEQMTLIQEAERKNGFVMPQEAIDYVLTGGSYVQESKYRILEQFGKKESPEDNIKFLKNVYGIGGHSDAIPGTGIWEEHDGNGITLTRKGEKFLLKWPKVEKRIRELIAADRYLSQAEKAEYPNYLHRREFPLERTDEPDGKYPGKAEYHISLGDSVYLGTKRYEVLSLGEDVVQVSEYDYPLLQKEFPRDQFDRMVAENPLNDQYRHEVQEPGPDVKNQDRTDEMLRQALLAAELSEQMVFAFEEGNPLPINLPKQQKPAETEIAPPPAPRRPRSMAPAMVAIAQESKRLNLPVPKANYHSVVLKPSEYQKEMVDGLAKRAEKVRNGMVNSSEDNMLVITNDGRKLALDQRLINEMLPESDTGKVAACADNVFDIWRRTRDQRSAQMIFCDLSTPHSDGHFNVYDAIRDKLIAKGVPAEEIAYIHSAGTEAKKKELFGKVRSGQIRVLIGSTQKMGAGTNVQKKLIALHHLDCPWRPADLQQREGRIVRQGNENPEVEIFTYVTEGTFDAYLYQLVESKQKFIGQIMTSKSPVRSAEDIDETALSYAEIKALCSGNPKIKLKMDLDVAVSKLKLLKANHLSQIYSLESDITHRYPRLISEAQETLEGLKADIQRRDQHTRPNQDGFSPMTVEGRTHTEKKAAGSAILEACKAMTNPDPVPLGQYRGFALELCFDKFSREYRLTLCGQLRHTISLGMDLHGNLQRIDNALDGLETRMESKTGELKHLKEQLETAKSEAKRPFPQEEELKEKQTQLDQLNIELNMDKPENEVLDDDREESEPEREARGQAR